MIFERKQSTKIRSCRLPLHVAWNNLVLSSKELQESILTYTPVQVEQIYQQLKSFGFKYHIQVRLFTYMSYKLYLYIYFIQSLN